MNIQKIDKKNRDVLLSISLSLIFFLPYIVQNKPIWIDEFLHLSISSYATFAEAFNVTLETLKTVNHGQTGFYILSNWLLMDLIGFNKYSLRLPSIIALLIVLYAINILRLKANLNISQFTFLLIVLAGNYNLSQYISEARPYYPLAASNITLLIYLYLLLIQKVSVRSLFVCASFFGVLMHPYFIAYFLLLVTINIFVIYRINRRTGSKEQIYLTSEFKKFILPLSILVTIISLLLYVLAWGNRSWDISRDPFEFSGEKIQFIIYFLSGNFSFFSFTQIASYRNFLTIFLMFVFALYYLIVIYLFLSNKALMIRVFIGINFGSIIFISILISYLSFSNDYWILTRQWLGSTIIFMFLIFLVYLHSQGKIKKLLYFLTICFFVGSISYQIESQLDWIEIKNKNKLEFVNLEINFSENLSVDELVSLANWNLENKNEKWDIFTRYYENKMYE
jgi:hypothetical protein